MNQWLPEQVFVATFCTAALAGLAKLLHSDDPLTLRAMLAAVLFNGVAGTGFGMVAYEFMGGKTRPWLVIGCGMLVGIRVIKIQDIVKVVKRILGNDNDSDPND